MSWSVHFYELFLCYHHVVATLISSLLHLQTEYARFETGRFVYRINRSPMCDYMVSFIHRLKHLPEKYMMNSVLENFTILQVSCMHEGEGGEKG